MIEADQLRIEIILGNAAMRSLSDAGHAIARALGDDISDYDYAIRPLEAGASGIIRDLNGNTVGKWEATRTRVTS